MTIWLQVITLKTSVGKKFHAETINGSNVTEIGTSKIENDADTLLAGSTPWHGRKTLSVFQQ